MSSFGLIIYVTTCKLVKMLWLTAELDFPVTTVKTMASKYMNVEVFCFQFCGNGDTLCILIYVFSTVKRPETKKTMNTLWTFIGHGFQRTEVQCDWACVASHNKNATRLRLRTILWMSEALITHLFAWAPNPSLSPPLHSHFSSSGSGFLTVTRCVGPPPLCSVSIGSCGIHRPGWAGDPLCSCPELLLQRVFRLCCIMYTLSWNEHTQGCAVAEIQQ